MILENARLRVEIADLGAELMSVYDKSAQTELLWNGDPAYWKRRAPILFPNVGKTYNNTMKINGQSFATSQHGFARDSMFTCEQANEQKAVYLLRSSDETLKKYPFAFELRIIYALENDRLQVCWQVKNNSECAMPFTIGGHPAFCFENPTDAKEDYCLEFPGKDTLAYILLDPDSGTAVPEVKYPLPLENHMLHLSDALFARDAMIFDGSQIAEAWLCRRDGQRRVGMFCPGFPNYGVWSVKGAPFVCLEPWMGRADNVGFADELAEKPNINILVPGETFEKSHWVLLP